MIKKALLDNPFKTDAPVTGKNFIPRPEEMYHLQKLVLEINQSAALIAPRRYGKSSLIKNFFQEINLKKYIPIYFNLFKIPNKIEFAEQFIISFFLSKFFQSNFGE